MKQPLSLTTRVVASGDHLTSQVQQELVLLHLAKSEYFGMNPVAASIWRLIQQPASVAQIVEHIVAEYDVTSAVAEQDVLAFLQQLQQHGLLRQAH